jgi:choline dehydrogenase-like flavoprotein
LSQKIADLSIPPGNVGANTNNTALVIGEKAADIILNDLGLKKGRSTYLNGQPN